MLDGCTSSCSLEYFYTKTILNILIYALNFRNFFLGVFSLRNDMRLVVRIIFTNELNRMKQLTLTVTDAESDDRYNIKPAYTLPIRIASLNSYFDFRILLYEYDIIFISNSVHVFGI